MDNNGIDSEKYFLDADGYYVTFEEFDGIFEYKECPKCGELLNFIHSEKYWDSEGGMMIIGVLIHRLECKKCKCSFIHNNDF